MNIDSPPDGANATRTTLAIPHIDPCKLCNLLPYGDYIIIDARSKASYEKQCIIGSISCPPQDIDHQISHEWLAENVIEATHRDKFSWVSILRVVIAGDNSEDPWVQLLFELFCRKEFSHPPTYISVPTVKRRYPLLIAPEGEKRLSYKFRYPSEMIEDFLWLGSMQSAHSTETIQGLRITHIVDATNHTDSNKFPDVVKYLNVDIDDDESSDLTPFFQPVCKFIDQALEENGRVLVHCQAGISRSASLVINYMRHHYSWNLRQAYRHAIECRPEIHPNRSFMLQLMAAEAALSEEGVSSLHESDLGHRGGLVEDKNHLGDDRSPDDWRPFMSLPGRTQKESDPDSCVIL
jgi:protein-tyrosine phosphatase/rhodanese-related sulfurtransferase